MRDFNVGAESCDSRIRDCRRLSTDPSGRACHVEPLTEIDLKYRIGASRIIRVASEKPVPDTPYNDGAYVSCRCARSHKLMTPSCTGLADVQVGYGLRLVALRAEISRSACIGFRRRRRVTHHG